MCAQKLFGLKISGNMAPSQAAGGNGQSPALPHIQAPKEVEAGKLAPKIQPPAESVRRSGELRREVLPHAFVVMPFGKKKGVDNQILDFNAIYAGLIQPALELAGFEPFRADEETTSGDILTDMFQELLLADLVICDMSIDNANVFYELGIRHAFRKRGIVHIQSGRAYMPFDVFNVRTIPYHTTPEGLPDPAFLDKDRQAIARVTRDTWASDADAVHSPIFNLLTGLPEPDRQTLRTPLATGFWREYNEWKQRVSIARRQKRIGDILLLTEEIQNPLIKEEAIGEAGRALKNMGRNELALRQYRKGLEVNPRNLGFRREESFNLNRVGRVDEAIVKIENLLADFPNDTESIAYLGRIYKEMWCDSWNWITDRKTRLRTAFDSYHWLTKSFNIYLKGYRQDLNQFYPGVNALTLGTILVHLADRFDDARNSDPDIQLVRETLPELRGALEFALEAKAEDEQAEYWTLISLAELRVLTSQDVREVTRAYRKALTASRRNLFFLQSSLAQLEMLLALDMHADHVRAGIKAIREEISRMNKEMSANGSIKKSSNRKRAGQVFLFTGYMIDHAGKEHKSFTSGGENEIRTAIRKVLDKFHAGPHDLAFTAGLACGSEILFAECCAERGLRVEAHFPQPEAAYIREFVSPGGEEWVDRFYKIRNHPLVNELYQSDHVGEPKDGDDPYERNNRWALYSSLIRGIDKVRLIALWDGKPGYGSDLDVRLVRHMVDLMRETGGIIEQINPGKFLPGFIPGAYNKLPDRVMPIPLRRKARKGKD
jgi:tetratricopeptide (TPR) repeat protein